VQKLLVIAQLVRLLEMCLTGVEKSVLQIFNSITPRSSIEGGIINIHFSLIFLSLLLNKSKECEDWK
jgi:hypothetical protein